MAQGDGRGYGPAGGPRTVATTAQPRPHVQTNANEQAARYAQARGTQAQALSNNVRFWQDEPENYRATLNEFLGATEQPLPTGPAPLRSPGSGGGGGGGGGMSMAEIQALADQAYAFDVSPYDQQRAAIANQRGQVEGYNPDFAAMQTEYTARAQAAEQARAQAVQQRLGAIGTLGSQLAGQQATALNAGGQDIMRAGGNLDSYMGQANQIAGDRVGTLGNQGQYLGQLNALSANTLADSLRASGMITQGGQATLANNRGQMLNQLGANEAGIAQQQAAALAANNQNRAQFLAQYGVKAS